MSAPVAQFENVTKVFHGVWPRRGVTALCDVSFRVEPGEVFGLLGPNRAGKTTLTKVLLGLCRPTSGKVLRLGQPVHDRSTLARVGYMHENQAFPRYLGAGELLAYYGAMAQLEAALLAERIPELLEKVGLADRGREPIARFSKGMVQRLALAQAILNDPELLVLDEPTEGLDLLGRNLVHEVVDDMRRRQRGVLLVSHHLTDVEKLCGRVAVLVAGRLAHLGALADLVGGNEGERSLEEVLQPLYERAS